MASRSAKTALHVSACLLVLAALLLTQWRQVIPPKNDFLQFYIGAKLIGGGSYFSGAAFADLQRSLIPGLAGQFLPVHPPFESILLWPLALFSLNAAFVLFELLCLVSVGVFVALLLRSAPELPLYAAFSLPILFALINGQDVLLLLAPLAIALRCGGKRPFLTGMILALCSIKFHLFLALPVALVAQKRWRILQGMAAGLAALLAICFPVLGIRWPIEYFRCLQDPIVSPFQELMPNLHGLTVDLGWGLAAEMVLALAVVATVFWMCSRSVALEYALAAGVTGGLLVSHHAYLHDTCVLVFVFAALRSAVAGISLRLLALIVLPPVYLIAILDGVRAQGNMLLVALLLATLGSLLIVKRPALTAETVDALVTTGS